jgi:hypothetical protein
LEASSECSGFLLVLHFLFFSGSLELPEGKFKGVENYCFHRSTDSQRHSRRPQRRSDFLRKDLSLLGFSLTRDDPSLPPPRHTPRQAGKASPLERMRKGGLSGGDDPPFAGDLPQCENRG